jgi:hypothetical protein
MLTIGHLLHSTRTAEYKCRPSLFRPTGIVIPPFFIVPSNNIYIDTCIIRSSAHDEGPDSTIVIDRGHDHASRA